jgi:hypothetical protein
MKKLLLPFLLCAAFSANAQIYDTLPVIFHIIHNSTESVGAGRNLSQAQVYSQFDVINEDFRMANADIVNTPAPFLALAGDMGINFGKALVDPQGNPLAEPGIDRIDVTTLGLGNGPQSLGNIGTLIQPQTIWDPSQYLNIWVVDISGSGVLGASTWPANTGMPCLGNVQPDSLHDGVVIDYMCCGRIGTIFPTVFNKGRTLDYFLAHWLGLLNVDYNSCIDDCVTDTPVSYTESFGCPTFPVIHLPCSNGPNGAMYCNFLGYADDSCRTMFTQGQKARVDSVLTTGYYQSALRLSNTATAVGEYSPVLYSRIFPNPAADQATVSFGSMVSGEISIYDVSGRLVHALSFADQRQLTLGLSGYEAGLYAIVIVSKEGKVSRTKLVVE